MLNIIVNYILLLLFFIGAFSHLLKLIHLFFGFTFLEKIKAFSSKEDEKVLKICYYILAIGVSLYCILYKLGLVKLSIM